MARISIGYQKKKKIIMSKNSKNKLKELQMDFLDREIRRKQEGKDEWSNIMMSTVFEASDSKTFAEFEDAHEYDKTINVKARHRGELPHKIITYTCTDGTTFTCRDFECKCLYDARAHQNKLDQDKKMNELAYLLYGNGISSLDDMRNSIENNYSFLVRSFTPMMY